MHIVDSTLNIQARRVWKKDTEDSTEQH